MMARALALVLVTACFDPRPMLGQPCESWCPPPEACVAHTCQLAPDDGGGDGPVAIQGNYMFVTSGTKAPVDIGGLSGGDKWCNDVAASAHLPGHYTAWISSSAQSAYQRLAATGARGWYRTDGKPFADTLDDIAMGKTFYPPRVSERGADLVKAGVVDSTVATGSVGRGDDAPGADCAGFTSASGSLAAGYFDAGAYAWTEDTSSVSCSSPVRIYCFGDSENRFPVAPAPQSNVRRAFITQSKVTTGRAAMDAACMAAAPVPGTFLAWLPIQGQAANGRFTATTPWVRLDDVTVVAADFSDMVAPLNVDASGAYGVGVAWGGEISGPSEVPQNMMHDCFDWTSTFGGAILGDVARGNFHEAFSHDASSLTNCGNNFYVYCLEQ